MAARTRVLITGASVAGPTLAYWLACAGHEVTVLEQAPALRTGGQNIDVRASGREVVRRMGLEDAVRARGTGEVGTRLVDESGAAVAAFPVRSPRDGSGPDGPTADLEILRGALSGLVVDACPDTVTWRFGDQITAVRQDGTGVDVEFTEGTPERFDLLVVAEGAGSRTRRLVFGDEPRERPLGMYMTYGTIAREPGDDDWWQMLITSGARQVSLRPDDVGGMRAMLNFRADTPELNGLTPHAVRRTLCVRFADLGWEVPRILDGFEAAEDLYVDWLRQIDCPVWHRGRVCLLGDAAWCVTPIGGGGTSLALTGGYVLAAFLSQAGPDGHAEAFTRYETWMRPLVGRAQKLPPGVPAAAAPRTRAGVRALRWGARVAALPLVRTVATRLAAVPEAEQELPRLVAAGQTAR